MVRFIAFVCLLLVAVSASEFEQFESSVEFVDNIETYLAENPNAQLIELQGENVPFAKTRYVFGQRRPGDRVIANRNDNLNYGRMQDVRINLNYPANGVGAVITFLDVNMEYNSNLGKLTLLEGGIGQRKIRFYVEAKGVTHFSANITLWGY